MGVGSATAANRHTMRQVPFYQQRRASRPAGLFSRNIAASASVFLLNCGFLN